MNTEKSGNTWSIICGGSKLTFWARAMASVGKTEAWRHSDGLWASVTAWGWMVSFTRKLPHRDDYYRGLWNINLPWLHYDRNRGGSFAHFKWGQKLARWREDRARTKELWKKQHRKLWWEARRGQWWEFDENETRSYYKFLRAVYGMGASEAWEESKKHTR